MVCAPRASDSSTSATAVESADVETITPPQSQSARVKQLPLWKVLLHNDDVNEAGFVVETIIELTPLNAHDAMIRMVEAHKTGISLLMSTHREHAELLQEQFTSKSLTVTIEPD